jgi:outer membrane protein insertion porin family
MPEVVASLRANVGNVVGFGEDVRINDRFYIGGDEFRGFRTGGVGTRDSGSGDALGAQNYYVLTQEVSFPLGLPKELGLSARLFHDIGSAWGADVTGSGTLDSTSLRAAVGIGFTWVSPFGPIRVDFGIPYLKQKFDRTQNFTFGFATRY